MSGPLGHIRVLELSRILAGPWAAQTLADLGASVIKVERPKVGDDTRSFGPPFVIDREGRETRESAYFLSANRGKRSITVDFTRPEGQRLVRELARRSDVIIENFKVGGLSQYGLDYDSLRALHPGIVYCSITGFGQTGPYRNRPGYDFMIQGIGGLMSITGEPDAHPGGGPVKVGVAVADIFTGLYATIGIMGALAHRDRTGQGQLVDMALLDSQVAILANQALNYLVSGTSPGRMGNAHPNIVPYQSFVTSDGYILVAIANDGQFTRFCELAGRPDLALDPRYATNPARVANRTELVTILVQLMARRSSREWLEGMERLGIPSGPVNNIAQVFADEQVQARGLRIDLPHPLAAAGTVPSVANPIKYSATPLEYELAPPLLGAHTDAVLTEELGLTQTEIVRLRELGVI